MKTAQGRARLKHYFKDLIALGKATQTGVILESPTWVAHRDRGAAIGYDVDALKTLNRAAIAMMADVRSETEHAPTIISANIGPRDDAYARGARMDADDAERYHAEQIALFAETEADVVSAYTLAYQSEAVGIVRAARRHGLPVVISFTVETDGRLPTGAALEAAISDVDAATDAYTAYFMINCAHPEHFSGVLEEAPWMQRVRGGIANASRCSHAELDGAEELDDGDPAELVSPT